ENQNGHRRRDQSNLREHIETGTIGKIEIENDDVPVPAPHFVDRFISGARFAADDDVRRLRHDLLQPFTNDVVVIRDQHRNHDFLGILTETIVPRSATPSICATPPTSVARSRMPIRPSDFESPDSSSVTPRPSSRISSSTSSLRARSRNSTRVALEWRTTFVSAS